MSPASLLEARAQKHRRLTCAVDVEVDTGVVSERTQTHDLSAGGMFVSSAQPWAVGMVVDLRFELDGRRYLTRAAIVHVAPYVGFGAMFLDLTRGERMRILRFVHTGRAAREAERLLAERVG